MSMTSIGFDIFAKDRASDVFDKVGRKAGETAGFWEKHKATIAAGAAAVGAGIIAIGAESIRAASDQNEIMSKSRIIFGKNSDAIEQWASNAATSMGLSKTAALESASGFGDMFSQLGFTTDAATKMSQQVVSLSSDLGSFNNLPTAEVTEMMSGAFRGEYDSLQRLIPNISASRVEHEAMITTGKKSADQLTAQEKAAATLAIVMHDGARAQGDFARTSNGLANEQKIAAAQFENLQATLGTKLLPVGVKVVGWLTNMMTWIQHNTGAVQVVIGVIGTLAVGLGGLMILQKVSQAMALFNVVLAANPIGIVVVAIAALAAGLIYAYKNSETFRNIVNGAFQAIGAIARWLWNSVYAPFFRFLVNGFATVADWIGNMLDALSHIPGFGWAKDAADKMHNAADKARELSGNIRNIPDNTVTVSVAFRYYQVNKPPPLPVSSSSYGVSKFLLPGHAKGGRNLPPGPSLVGEEGPEIIDVPGGSDIYSNPESMAMIHRGASSGSSSGSGGDINLTVQLRSPDGRLMQQELLRIKRTQGGAGLGLA